MKLYIVRHGESTLNQKEIHQDGKVPLSPSGIKQAHKVALRLQKIPANIILASPFARARETAEIIATTLKKPLLFSPLFVELKRPTIIEGKQVNDSEVVKIKQTIISKWHDPAWHHSDEENFFDLKKRAISALTYLRSLSHESIVLVTHAEFIRMLFCVMMFGETLEVQVYKNLRNCLDLSNTGISVFQYKNDSWRLQAWNDHAHLPGALVNNFKN